MSTNNIIKRDAEQLKKAWNGLDFILGLFEVPKFPRTILTGASHTPHIVNSRDEAMMYIEPALCEDCYINAYLNYEWMGEIGVKTSGFIPVPNYIIIDLDREHFTSDDDFEAALNTTLQNIKANFTGLIAEYPIVVATGNGYHVHIPLPGFTTRLEDMPEFAAFKDDKDLPNKFLQWAEDTLSNNKADSKHNPAINSALFRMPGTLNTRARDRGRDPRIRIVQGIEYVIAKNIEQESLPADVFYSERASKPTTKFLNDFLGYLIQERIDDKVEKLQRRRYDLIHVDSSSSSNNSIAWIDKLLQSGIEDGRKDLIYWVLAPYLITIKKIEYDKAYHTIEAWLEKCDEIRSLEPGWKAFRYRTRYCLDVAEAQEHRPIRFETFKEYYPTLAEMMLRE
jgi:hypothetical protein